MLQDRSHESGERPLPAGNRVRPFACLLVAWLCLVGGLLVADSRLFDLAPEARPGVLQLEPRIKLSGVRLAELIPGESEVVSHGRWTGSYSVFDARAPRTQIIRRLPALWRMRLARGDQSDRLDVQYEITDQTGRRGHLAASGAPDSEVRVELRPIPPLVISEDAAGEVLEGGLVLYIDLASVRTAGVYSGTVTVTLNQL